MWPSGSSLESKADVYSAVEVVKIHGPSITPVRLRSWIQSRNECKPGRRATTQSKVFFFGSVPTSTWTWKSTCSKGRLRCTPSQRTRTRVSSRSSTSNRGNTAGCDASPARLHERNPDASARSLPRLPAPVPPPSGLPPAPTLETPRTSPDAENKFLAAPRRQLDTHRRRVTTSCCIMCWCCPAGRAVSKSTSRRWPWRLRATLLGRPRREQIHAAAEAQARRAALAESRREALSGSSAVGTPILALNPFAHTDLDASSRAETS
mmetsp:Transcript_88362/g.248919  ORF Transcript_88362/g.248919 Transcript_88362/m.248919 type:complete len:264 (-) Transcript_88362:3-794(-)